MGEQTDWYERGCSRSCRYEHKKVWGWCDLAEQPKVQLNLSIAEAFTASDGNTSVKIRQATIEEAEAELAKFRPVPDWSDLREMSRNAGWAPDTWVARDVHWGQRDPKRSLRTDLGWVSSRHFQGHHRVELHGPEPRPIRTVALIDPTPSEVLAAARLVGLVGGVS